MSGFDPASDGPGLEAWLSEHWQGVEAVSIGADFEKPEGSGFSATTLMIPVRVTRGASERDEKIVLRLEPPEEAIYPQQAPGLDVEIDIQWRSMQAIHASSKVPLAPLVGYEPSSALLGAPFYVMEYIAGSVPIENPPYVREGWYAEASAEERARMIDDGLRVLAEIHAIDWQAAGFDWLVSPGHAPGTATQVALWEAYARRELGEREHPLIERGFAWLHANAPRDTRVGLNWGDARPGNIIWQDFRAACVTDFENVSLGPPELDLGWWLMFDRWSHETQGIERLPGEPTREEQRAIYARHAGREILDTIYWEVLGAVRYSAIVVRVMNREVARGNLPADQMIWLNNPAATCLEQLLDEVGEGT